MKLVFSIPDKLWWITNFLDYSTYKAIHNSIIKERNDINLRTSKGKWKDVLINNITPPLHSPIYNYAPFEKLKTLVRHNPFFKFPDMIEMSTTTIHYMKKNSGINWHNDGSWKYGVTYYVNRRWNRDWGGEFMFTDTKGHGFLPYVGNSLVIVKSPLDHKVTPVLNPIIPRISLQMFMK